MPLHRQTDPCAAGDGTRPVRVVIAAAHAGVSAALATLIASAHGLEVIATAADSRTTARHLLQHRPDVLVLASPAALRDGAAEVRSLRERAPETALVVVSTASGDAYTSLARTAGATALVALDGPSEVLLDAVRAAGTRRERHS